MKVLCRMSHAIYIVHIHRYNVVFVCDAIDEYKREPIQNIGQKNCMKKAIAFVTVALLVVQVAGVAAEKAWSLG